MTSYRIHSESFKIIAFFSILSIFPLLTGSFLGAFILLAFALYTAWFFRYPVKVGVPENSEDIIISPAWGKITSVESVTLKDGSKGSRISIFLNIFNVHMQCSPVKGKIEKITYTKGSFENAMKPETSLKNEKNSLEIKNSRGYHQVDQIAGLIARRIICWNKEGEELNSGEYFGLIRFGSRVDVYFPDQFEPKVKPEDKVSGGDILAEIKK